MADTRDVLLSVNEWSNLLEALKTTVERYGLDAVEEAVDYIKLNSRTLISGRVTVR